MAAAQVHTVVHKSLPDNGGAAAGAAGRSVVRRRFCFDCYFSPFNRSAECRYGTLLFNQNDRFIGKSLEMYGEYSEGEIDLFRQVVRPGHDRARNGANIGTHTLFLARQVGHDGLVIAFEPQRLVFQCLCANIRLLNSVTNVQCRQQAVGTAPGKIKVPVLDPRRHRIMRPSLAGRPSGGVGRLW